MKQLLPILALITNCLLFQSYLQAQDVTLSDEQLIRNIIERANNGEQSIKFTDSIIRVFPDLPYPHVGKQRKEEEIILTKFLQELAFLFLKKKASIKFIVKGNHFLVTQ
jgi:hypothetical protein